MATIEIQELFAKYFPLNEMHPFDLKTLISGLDDIIEDFRDEITGESYNDGYNEGKEDGYDNGYDDGYEAARDSVLTALND